MKQATAPSPHATCRASQCSNSSSSTTQARPESRMYSSRECLVRLARALLQAVISLYLRLTLSGCGSGNCTITARYRAIITMLKQPVPDRSGTSRVSHVWLEGVPGQAHQGASASGYFVISSADAIESWIRQLHHHRTVSGDPHSAQTPAFRQCQCLFVSFFVL